MNKENGESKSEADLYLDLASPISHNASYLLGGRIGNRVEALASQGALLSTIGDKKRHVG